MPCASWVGAIRHLRFAARHDPAGGCGRLRIGHSVRWQHRARPARSYLRGLTRYCSGISYENFGVVAEGEAITRSTFIESLNKLAKAFRVSFSELMQIE